MNRRCNAIALSLVTMYASAAAAGTPEVRFHPSTGLWVQQTEASRGLGNVVLPNAAVVNNGPAPLTVLEVRFDLLQGDEVLQSQFVSSSRLDATARSGAALAQAGMMQALDFQFAPDRLLGPGVRVSDDRELAAGEALYLPTRFFAFAGRPDRLRTTVTFEGGAPAASGELAIRYGSAPGTFRFPLAGRWFVGAGSTPHSHHRWVVPQEFALDLMRVGPDGRTYQDEGLRVQDYYAYGEPVLAVAQGEVVKVLATMPDSAELMRRPGEAVEAHMARVMAAQDVTMQQGPDGIVGNYVLLRHADGVYTLYAHLAPGSVVVEAGAAVVAGQRLGAVGSSGSSTEPHLHFHACDAPDPLRCAGMPVAFDGIDLPFFDHPRQIQTGDFVDAPP